ncbi:MAG: hypothetical protein OET44_08190 [Gammaproteobacteria bacterium]|nr:hypothetical protein [Gammaproteobacteria bacterium]
MRYSEDQAPQTIYAQSEGLQFMLTFSVCLGLLIGVVLLWLGRHGRVLWLQAWSIGLIAVSIAYLAADLLGYVD